MKTKAIVAALLLAGSSFVCAQVASHAATSKAPSASAAMPLDRPVVRVNGTVLTQRDFLREEMNLFPYARQHGGRIPAELEPQIRQQATDRMVFEELVYQEALRRKMTVAPAKLAQAMSDFKKQFDSAAEYQEYLKHEQGGSVKQLRSKVRRAILIDTLLKAEVDRKATVPDLELKKFYDANQQRFHKPESVSIQTISLVIPDNATAAQKAEVRKRAEDALRRARATKDYEQFGVLAEKISEDDWRVMMGDHKIIHRGRMPLPVEKVVFAMQPGQVSDIIETENSFCIARVNAREESKQVPFPEVRAKLKKDLESEKRGQLEKAFSAALFKKAKIEQM